MLSSEPAAVPPVCRNESPFLFVFDISKLKLHHTPFKLILSYDEHIFGYRVRTPNAILIRNDKQSGNDRSTEEKRTVGIACACQNGYVRKSEPKLIGT